MSFIRVDAPKISTTNRVQGASTYICTLYIWYTQCIFHIATLDQRYITHSGQVELKWRLLHIPLKLGERTRLGGWWPPRCHTADTLHITHLSDLGRRGWTRSHTGLHQDSVSTPIIWSPQYFTVDQINPVQTSPRHISMPSHCLVIWCFSEPLSS